MPPPPPGRRRGVRASAVPIRCHPTVTASQHARPRAVLLQAPQNGFGEVVWDSLGEEEEVKGSVYQWEVVSARRHSGIEKPVCRQRGAKLMLRTEPCRWNGAISSITQCYRHSPGKLSSPKLQATLQSVAQGTNPPSDLDIKYHRFLALSRCFVR